MTHPHDKFLPVSTALEKKVVTGLRRASVQSLKSIPNVPFFASRRLVSNNDSRQTSQDGTFYSQEIGRLPGLQDVNPCTIGL